MLLHVRLHVHVSVRLHVPCVCACGHGACAGALCVRAWRRRFATFSEEQLSPVDMTGLRDHPLVRVLDGVANHTIRPLQQRAEQALANAIATIATEPEVLVWRLAPGDHLRVNGVAGFMALTHHAIYLGDGRIMHFTGGVTDKGNATIKVDTLRKLHKFTKSVGHKQCRIEVIPHPEGALPREQIVERALSRVGETGYNLLSKNCEHVVHWCITGQELSLQVNRFTQDPIGVGYSVLKEQADAGAPVNVQEICRTLLPPGLWEVCQSHSAPPLSLHPPSAALTPSR